MSGDGDDRLFWLEQQADHTFATHVLATGAGHGGRRPGFPVPAAQPASQPTRELTPA
ncbi:hypothetical protein ACFWTC_29565 [Streptomyces sp. NPDC058619]|uniref:hypothetical protein n=1 Tax=unclassified Streptomyces TaxID=2593676 RepID=UPI0036587D2A